MSFGLICRNEGGQIQLDTTTFTYRVIHSEIITFTLTPTTITRTIPGFNASNCGVFLNPHEGVPGSFPSNSPLDSLAMPIMEVSGSTFTIRNNRFPASGPNYSCKGDFTLVAFRYKV